MSTGCRRLVGLVLCSVSILTSPSWALGPTPRSGVASDAPRSTGTLQVGRRTLDTGTGFTISAFELNAGPYSGPPEAQARAYLSSAAIELGLDPSLGDLEVTLVQHTSWADIVRFRQSIAGIPVLESDVVVTIRRADGRVQSVMSRHRPPVNLDATTPLIAADRARQIAAAHLGVTGDRIAPERVELAALAQGGVATLVHRISLPCMHPMGDWEVLVDATTGVVLRTRNRMMNADGTGLVHDPDPLSVARVDYGAPGYADNGDASTPQLAAQRFARTLPDLTFALGVWRLEGPYCSIQDFEAPLGAPVTSADLDGFQFDRHDQGFEDVNVYWAIDMTQRYIQSLGFSNIQNGPIACDPHGVDGDDNSHYVPSTNQLAWGEGGVDDAEDLDVVLHEYGHAIQEASVPGWLGELESGAMGEGFGDYWAASYSSTVSDYHSNWVFNWDGHNDFWDGRVLDYPNHYPDGAQGEVHADGQMWSSNLWSVFKEIGRTVTDRTTLDHHFALGTISLFHQAVQSWIQSDQNLNEGLNVDTFVHWSKQRGFLLPIEYPLPEISHTPPPDTVWMGGPLLIAADVTSDSMVVAVEARYRHEGDSYRSVALSNQGNGHWTGAIPPLDPGVAEYFLVATTSDGYKSTEPRPAPTGGVHRFIVPGPLAVGDDRLSVATALDPIRPNPFRSGAAIEYAIGRGGRVSLAIFDVAGHRVRSLVDGVGGPGHHSVRWDGRTEAGDLAPAGVYYCRLATEEARVSRKVTLTRYGPRAT